MHSWTFGLNDAHLPNKNISHFWGTNDRTNHRRRIRQANAEAALCSKDHIALHCGDCRDVLAAMAENSFDAAVTDPPDETPPAQGPQIRPPPPRRQSASRTRKPGGARGTDATPQRPQAPRGPARRKRTRPHADARRSQTLPSPG